MRRCPACQNWTLDYDEYFARFRCFAPGCGWMPMSSAERQIQLLRTRGQPKVIARGEIPQLGLSLTCSYDESSDALVFDFGLDEPSFDLPEPDGRLIWRIGRLSGSVTGCAVLGAKKLGVSEVRIDFGARKVSIEEGLKRLPGALGLGRASRVLIESVQVTAHTVKTKPAPSLTQITNEFRKGITKFEREYAGT